MADITKYQLVDSSDHEVDGLYDSEQEAIAAARAKGNHAVIAVEFEFSDSELVWTPSGQGSWPPRG
ncbi:hypothetical protein MUG78_17445 [Gordonia alkaliphila]|uniref:hypothetical protein n=1 Tax=Gordonia alkaliphila TaxID=1053547 RepID=UPI001FF48CBD|nr:hypothetical protein [Gordonia alkaliphila]MCK0441186.1 hypothetical protein [Gordonia alkaliphila]